MLIIVSFLAYLPHSKHLHIATAAFNVYFARTRARGRLEPLRFDVPEEEMRFGAGTVPDLTWKQTLDTFSCTECGRCQDVCPAWTTGKELSPKLLIMALRDQVFEEGPRLIRGEEGFEPSPLVPNAVTDNVVWDCVTCGACVRECPVSIEHVDHIIDLRRHLVMMDSSFPAESEQMLRDVERASNPWGKPQTERADWAAELGVRVLEPGDPAPEVLYWVGCAASFDERARTAAQSTAKLLKAAGVDFAILGPRESCTGDPARRIGNEYLFQAHAEQNVGTLNEAGVTKIVASCPHCFNTLGNEYSGLRRQLRGRAPHRAARRPGARRAGSRRRATPARSPTTTPATWPATTTCAPTRASWSRRSGTPIEMERSGERTFCCGAGGAHMWMEERAGLINEERAREAAETGAETLAVACPFCTVMLDDGVRARGDELRVVDVSTLLAESLEPRRSALDLLRPRLAVLDDERRERGHRRVRRRDGRHHAQVRPPLVAVELAAHVAATVAVEELDVGVERDHRPVVGAVANAVSVRRDRRAHELGRHDGRVRVLVVRLQVVHEGGVPVAGDHHRVAHLGFGIRWRIRARWPGQPSHESFQKRPPSASCFSWPISTPLAITFQRARERSRPSSSQRSCSCPVIVASGSKPASQGGCSPSPHGLSVRYWRVSSTLKLAMSP